MSETKFTKKEWIAEEYMDGTVGITTEKRRRDSKVDIVKIDIDYDGAMGEEQEANAHLIAAAPDNYHANVGAMRLLEDIGLESSDEYQALLAATRKARGE